MLSTLPLVNTKFLSRIYVMKYYTYYSTIARPNHKKIKHVIVQHSVFSMSYIQTSMIIKILKGIKKNLRKLDVDFFMAQMRGWP